MIWLGFEPRGTGFEAQTNPQRNVVSIFLPEKYIFVQAQASEETVFN